MFFSQEAIFEGVEDSARFSACRSEICENVDLADLPQMGLYLENE